MRLVCAPSWSVSAPVAMKALEKLYELENAFSDRDRAASLIRALNAGEEGESPDDN